MGSSGNIVFSYTRQNTATFSFSEPVTVNSILALEGVRGQIEYTFTAVGGSYPTVVVMILNRTGNVTINWTEVTSFTVTSPSEGAMFGFDNLLLNGSVLALDDHALQKPIVYPSPVEDILYVKNITDLKNIRVFNILRQEVLETKELEINFSKLPSGIYTLQINTDTGIENKKIIKK